VTGIGRLLEVLKRSQPAGLLRFLLRPTAGQDDHLHVGVLLLDPLQHLHTVDTRHPQIEHHYIRRFVLDHLQCFLTTERHPTTDIPHVHSFSHRPDVVFFVIDE
jgi:hypothetical protein